MAKGGARPGAGRPKGSINRVPKPLKELAKTYTVEAVDALVRVIRDMDSPAVAVVAAANAILDRGHGKPTQAVEHSGPDGSPIEMSIDDRRAAARALLDDVFREEKADGQAVNDAA